MSGDPTVSSGSPPAVVHLSEPPVPPSSDDRPELRTGAMRLFFGGSTPGPPAAEGPSAEGGEGAGRRIPRRALVIAGVVVVLGYVVLVSVLSSRVPRGTTVSGVDIGGLGRAAAEQRLTAAAREVPAALPVRAADATGSVDVKAAGLEIDAAASVDPLVGWSPNPLVVWRHLAGGGEHVAATRGGDGLEQELAGLAALVREPAQDAAVTLTGGEPAVRDAVVGTELDTPAAIRIVREGWLAGPRPLVLPTREQQPAVTQAEAETALTELAEPAMSGPLALVVGDRPVTLPPEKFAGALAIAPDKEGELDLVVDGTKLRDAVLAADPKIGVAPKDARIELRDGRPVVVPGVAGVTIDPKALVTAVEPALLAAGDDRRAEIETAVKEPELTTKKAEALGVKEKVSTFSTNLTSDPGRTENLRLAARAVNGTLVLPGETFSLNETLGERTPEKGYNEAPAISGGRLVKDYGGGVSQMATTIFNNVFFAGLEDVYHKPHSFYISRYPEGREATVNWPDLDLKWRNDSPHGVLIEASVGSKVTVSFWSTKVWDEITAEKGPRTNIKSPKTIYDEREGCVTQAPVSGFDVSVRRLFHRDGRVVKTETFRTTYIPEDKVVCGPKPKAKQDPRSTPAGNASGTGSGSRGAGDAGERRARGTD